VQPGPTIDGQIVLRGAGRWRAPTGMRTFTYTCNVDVKSAEAVAVVLRDTTPAAAAKAPPPRPPAEPDLSELSPRGLRVERRRRPQGALAAGLADQLRRPHPRLQAAEREQRLAARQRPGAAERRLGDAAVRLRLRDRSARRPGARHQHLRLSARRAARRAARRPKREESRDSRR
jgi:hypothetical protein